LADQLAKQVDYPGDQVVGARGQFCQAVGICLSDQFVLPDFDFI